jgi:hypothetical protein
MPQHLPEPNPVHTLVAIHACERYPQI